MDKKIQEVLKQCEEFIDSSTPEELITYHESLNIDYESYGLKEAQMKKLNPCPFCGGEAKLMTMNYETFEPVVWDEGFGNTVDTWIHCYGCDTDFHHSDVTLIPPNIELWWNRREPIDKIVEQLGKHSFEWDNAIDYIETLVAMDIVKKGGQ